MIWRIIIYVVFCPGSFVQYASIFFEHFSEIKALSIIRALCTRAYIYGILWRLKHNFPCLVRFGCEENGYGGWQTLDQWRQKHFVLWQLQKTPTKGKLLFTKIRFCTSVLHLLLPIKLAFRICMWSAALLQFFQRETHWNS